MEQAGIGPGIGTLEGRHAATQVRISAERLLALDDLWTAELEQAQGEGRLDEDAVKELVRLGEEMQAALFELKQPLEGLSQTFASDRNGVVAAAYREILGSGHLPPGLVEEIPADFGGEFQRAVVEACDFLLESTDDESRVLAAKLSKIVELGEVPEGDLRPGFRCALVLAAAGAGVAVSIFDGGAVVTVVLEVAVDVGKGLYKWFRKDCPRWLAGIRRGPRE